MTVALNVYFPSSPGERDAARQIDYMSHLDFMAGEVIFTQMFLNSLFRLHLNGWNVTAGRGSAQPLVATADWSCVVGQSCLRPLHSLPVSTLWAGAVGRGSPGHTHPVGSCGSAFQNQSGVTARSRVVIQQTAPDWRKRAGCWDSFEKRHSSMGPAGYSSGYRPMQIFPLWCICQFNKIALGIKGTFTIKQQWKRIRQQFKRLWGVRTLF